MKNEFVHHHVHGSYSLLDGLSAPMEIAQRVHELGQRGWSMTDHGTLAGAYEATLAARKYNLQVNIGCELYFTENRLLKNRDRYGQQYYHLIAIATNMTGYKNLLKMQSIGHREGFYYKPRIDFEILEKHHEGIIFTTACLGSHVNQALLKGDYDLAVQRLGTLTDAVGKDNIYVEIQNQGLEEEIRILPQQVQLAKEAGLPLLPTGDCHYAYPHQADHHDSLLCCSTKAKKSQTNRFKFDTDQFYIMSSDEMANRFGDVDLYPDALKNTIELMDRCEFVLPTGSTAGHIMPHVDVDEGETEDSFLRKRVLEGARSVSRYGDGKGTIPSDVQERIDYELSIVEKMGFAGYFLMVADICDMFKKNNIEVGPGRGSAPGSVAIYCLGITNVDPMQLGLYFERFLNPDRISFPDIDIDIPKNKRPEALRLLQDKYGADCVAQISNFNTMTALAAISQASKIFELSFAEESALKELVAGNSKVGALHLDGIMGELNLTLQEVADKFRAKKLSAQHQRSIRAFPHVQQVLDTACSFEGVISAESKHACGIVILPDAVDNYFPIRLVKNEPLAVVQFEKNGVEDTGGVKMDILGLENLDECASTERNILLDLGEHVDSSQLVPDDQEVFDMLSKGEGSGVFQLSCLPGDTMVDGISLKRRYETFRPNKQKILSVDLDRKKAFFNNVHHIVNTGVKQSLTLVTRTNRQLTCSPEHKIFTRRGWVEAGNLIAGVDQVLSVKYKEAMTEAFRHRKQQRSGFTMEENLAMLRTVLEHSYPKVEQWSGYVGTEHYPIAFVCGDDVFSLYKERHAAEHVLILHTFKELYPEKKLHVYHTSEIVESYYRCSPTLTGSIPESTYWDTISSIEQGEDMEMFDIVMSAPTHNFIAEGIVVHNSGGMRELMMEMKPRTIDDLAALVALYRPGPLGMGTHMEYCRRKNGEVSINDNLPHADMAELLEETYGLVCYQEDMMSISVHFAGYTGAEADHLRKATAKKIPEMMQQEKEKFIPAVNQRFDNNLGEKLWEIMEPFAAYAFNKSHAAAYAALAYRTAYLKCHYPAQFGAAILDNAGEKDKEKRKKCLAWMKRWGITILPPDVNATALRSITTKDSVMLSPKLMNGIGDALLSTVLKERQDNGEFTSIIDFLSRVKAPTSSVMTMIQAGYFDTLHQSRRAMLANLSEITRRADQSRSYSSLRDGLFGDVLEESTMDLMEGLNLDDYPEGTFMVEGVTFDDTNSTYDVMETTALSVTCGKHPYTVYEPAFKAIAARNKRVRDALPISRAEEKLGDYGWFYGIITSAEQKVSEKGNKYLRLTISDDTEDVTCFSRKEPRAPLENFLYRPVFTEAKVQSDRDGRSFSLSIQSIDPIKKKEA